MHIVFIQPVNLNYFVFINSYSNDYNFGIFLINIIIYLFSLSVLFSLFFCYSSNTFKSFLSLKNLDYSNSFTIIFLVTILSIAGVPPMVGFGGKFLLFLTVILNSSLILFVILVFFNSILFFFYVQTIRYIIVHKILFNNVYVKSFVHYDERLIIYMLFSLFFICFGLVCLGSSLTIVNYGASLLYIV